MKNIILTPILFLTLAILFVNCSEFEDDNYDLSSQLPQYVELGSDAYSSSIDTTLVNGMVVHAEDSSEVTDESITATARLRVARSEEVNVSYEVTGDISSNGNVTIPVGELSAPIEVTIPYTDALSGSAEITIVDVDNDLTIGRSGAEDLDNTSASITWAAQ